MQVWSKIGHIWKRPVFPNYKNDYQEYQGMQKPTNSIAENIPFTPLGKNERKCDGKKFIKDIK